MSGAENPSNIGIEKEPCRADSTENSCGALQYVRRLPVGAEPMGTQGVHFRVWAPRSENVEVLVSPDLHFETRISSFKLSAEPHGYFSGIVSEAQVGSFYKFKLASGAFPDPASRFQPLGPHGPSQVIDPAAFKWTDREWPGIAAAKAVIYEMHIGTFTAEGTWRAAMEQLPELAELGVSVLEIMPVADFTGRFGWGYDGVNLFAPTRLYGTPDEFRAFVDRAHGLGLGVILDVVYNHCGPCGCYVKEFSKDYFTDRYENEWGESLNFDGQQAGPVREFFLGNAGYWVDEFHLDGLRLDATQQIFDNSANHVLGAISRRVRDAGKGKSTYLVAENEPQQSQLVRPFVAGGFGMQAVWNDDFHHAAKVALTGRSEAYFTDYVGRPQEFISLAKRGFLYQGQYYKWQKKNRGSSTAGVEPWRFINYLQNHDQVANSLAGKRIHELSHPAALRALTALLLLGPWTPLIFQGQEFGAASPFLYFADHSSEPELARLVASGRRDFLCQFESIAAEESLGFLPSPNDFQTFARSKLNFSEREKHEPLYRLHRDLLLLRRDDPVFFQPKPGAVDGAVLSPNAFALRYFGGSAGDRLLVVNLGADIALEPIPEPLLAPPENGGWELRLCTESPFYGGAGVPAVLSGPLFRLPANCAMVFVESSAE